jgi:hypothetical protein
VPVGQADIESRSVRGLLALAHLYGAVGGHVSWMYIPSRRTGGVDRFTPRSRLTSSHRGRW